MPTDGLDWEEDEETDKPITEFKKYLKRRSMREDQGTYIFVCPVRIKNSRY